MKRFVEAPSNERESRTQLNINVEISGFYKPEALQVPLLICCKGYL